MCKSDTEDELHALFICQGNPELNNVRALFYASIKEKAPGLIQKHYPSPLQLFQALYNNKSLVELLAHFIYSVLHIFKSEPILYLEELPTT